MAAGDKIFIVEDELITAENIRASLVKSGYTVTGIASSGEAALSAIKRDVPNLVLLDIKLKGSMDGIETAKHIAGRHDIPVIYLTAFTDAALVERAKLTASYGYMVKPFEDRELASNIEIAIGRHRLEKKVRESEARYREISVKLGDTLSGTLVAMGAVVELRDHYTAGHQRRVSSLASAIAVEMRLPADQVEGIRLAASIHDIGKIGVPFEILSKPAKLSPIEMQYVMLHSQAGYEILKNIEFPWPIAEIVYQHHERLDGSGYPRGLAGGDIVLGARILMVADVMEAIASHRLYRPALGVDAAVKELNDYRGVKYDADAVDAGVSLFNTKEFYFEEEPGSPGFSAAANKMKQ
ncbi:MAG: response regulator [Planctomycetes bacterium]|nr:response regulator [Planctomycetota bacterium]